MTRKIYRYRLSALIIEKLHYSDGKLQVGSRTYRSLSAYIFILKKSLNSTLMLNEFSKGFVKMFILGKGPCDHIVCIRVKEPNTLLELHVLFYGKTKQKLYHINTSPTVGDITDREQSREEYCFTSWQAEYIQCTVDPNILTDVLINRTKKAEQQILYMC